MNIASIPKNVFSFLGHAYRGSKTRFVIAIILALSLIGFGIYAILPKGATTDPTNPVAPRSVELQSVASLSTGGENLDIVGTIQSETEATVRAESSGQITSVYRMLGDKIVAGSVIAEMDNASQRAALLQAQGGVQAAEANLAKVKAGARPEQVAILQSAAGAAHAGSVNALLSAYASIDDSVHHSADLMFSNPDTYSPSFNVTITDSQLSIDIPNERVAQNPIIAREQVRADTLSQSESSDSLHAELQKTLSEVRTTRDFFDDLIAALGKAVTSQTVSASEIATWKASASASRSALSGSLSALTSADNALTSADENLALGVKGGTDNDIAAAEAAVTQAQGGLAAARAGLEKTVVRAPISGTINMISLNRGDFVSAGSPVVTIANNGTLEVLVYVTENDAERIAVGDKVTIENTGSGTVTRIAPALDPISKKIEVRIAIVQKAELTNGQSVIVRFGAGKPSGDAPKEMIVPLAAIKIEVDATSVFSVDAGSNLVAHQVELGSILGDRVIITAGLTPSDIIVTDARGLKAGMHVTVK